MQVLRKVDCVGSTARRETMEGGPHDYPKYHPGYSKLFHFNILKCSYRNLVLSLFLSPLELWDLQHSKMKILEKIFTLVLSLSVCLVVSR